MSTNNGNERLTYTVEEVASLLGVSRSAAYQAVRTGELPSIRLGQRIIIPKKKIEEMMAKSQGLLQSTPEVCQINPETEQIGNDVLLEDGKKLIYLMQLEPVKYPELVKVGYTEGIRNRLWGIKTVQPRVKLIKTWQGRLSWEAALINMLKQDDGCVYLSGELFECNSLSYLTARIDYFVRKIAAVR